MEDSLLKTYYKLLIAQRPEVRRGWHDEYKDFCEKISKLRNILKKGNTNFSANDVFKEAGFDRAIKSGINSKG